MTLNNLEVSEYENIKFLKQIRSLDKTRKAHNLGTQIVYLTCVPVKTLKREEKTSLK